MLESWLLEAMRALGRMFLNPMLYLGFFVMFFSSYQRIRRERLDFGIRVNPPLMETKGVWAFSLLGGLVVSVVMLGTGFVFSYETILMLNLSVILLGIGTRYAPLSAGYTVVLAAFALYMISLYSGDAGFLHTSLSSVVNYSGLAVLAGLLLIYEAIMVTRVKTEETFPQLILSKRGKWIGSHQIKKLSFLPFFLLIPIGAIEHAAGFWPYISIGGKTFGLMIVPFIIGFDYKIAGCLPMEMKKQLANKLLLVGIIVLIAAGLSLYQMYFAVIAFALAFIGKEWIHFQYKKQEEISQPFFREEKEGLDVLGVLANSPAERSGMKVGERVYKVNGSKIASIGDLEQALVTSGSFCKLEIIGIDGEKRLEQTALYDTDHHRLGLILVGEPYDQIYAAKKLNALQP